MSYRLCWLLASRIRMERSSILILLASSQHNLYDIYILLCVQWKTPDDGQRNCPKHVEFYSKNKFEKLVHLVGCITRFFIILRRRNLNRGDNHPTKNSNPSCTAIIYTLPPLSRFAYLLQPRTGPLPIGCHFRLPPPIQPTQQVYIRVYTLYIISLTFFIHLSMKMEPIRSSEMSAIKIQTPGNYPNRNILQRRNR